MTALLSAPVVPSPPASARARAPSPRTPRARRRPPRPRAWRRCGARWTSPTRTSSPSASGSASSSSSAASAASASSTAASSRACSRRRFFDGPVGLRRRRRGRRRGRLRGHAFGRRSSPWRDGAGRRRRRGGDSPARLALLAHARVLRPAADVGAQRVVLDGDGARADGVEQRAVVGDEQQRARRSALQRVLERLAALEVEVVRRLVEDRARWRRDADEDRQRRAAGARRRSARRAASRPPRR